MLVVLTCPNCGAQMQIEADRQFAFCQYCGTKVANLSSTVEVDRSSEIQNLLIRAMEFEQRGDYARAEQYCSRILDLDPQNALARNLESRLPSSTPFDNIAIVYRSTIDSRFKLRVTTDGKNWIVLSPNEQKTFSLPVGNHKIQFSGTKNYVQNISVIEPKERITIVYTANKGKNSIDVQKQLEINAASRSPDAIKTEPENSAVSRAAVTVEAEPVKNKVSKAWLIVGCIIGGLGLIEMFSRFSVGLIMALIGGGLVAVWFYKKTIQKK